MVAKSSNQETTLIIPPIRQEIIKLRIIGTTPMFQNRMAEKARQQLLVGSAKKTKAERVEIKHDPLSEFRSSAEMLKTGPTALGFRVVAVKAAMCQAALETPGLTKTSAQRLLFMPGDHYALYGTPQLRIDVVRSADINRTPDMRSRCFIPRWGAEVEIRYVRPALNASGVASLLANAGFLIGIGDFRQDKGKGAFGSFRVIGPDEHDAEWNDLVAHHGRDAQIEALRDPEFANEETEELMDFYKDEVHRRAA